MNASDLSRLTAFAADVAAVDGGVLASVTMGEMADGSGRSFALVDTIDHGLEQQYRISSPAPAGAAPWARVYDAWLVEVRTGDSWMHLELELVVEAADATAAEAARLVGDEVPS